MDRTTSCGVCNKNFTRVDNLKRHEKTHMDRHIFITPCAVMVSGCTSSGKTTWVKKVLENKDSLFNPPPQRILYCYGAWQPLYEKIIDIKFHEGLPTKEEIEDFADGLIVLDDLLVNVVKYDDTQALFTRESHHKNITVLYVTQNTFCQGTCARTISLNCAYLVLMRNPRDVHQIRLMGRQIGLPRSLPEAFEDCMEENYGYLVIDLSPHHPGLPRMFSHMFPNEDQVSYVPMNTSV